MKNYEKDLCDVLWWEDLKTYEDKDKYCIEHYGMSFADFWKEVEKPTVKYDPITKNFITI